MSEYIQIGRSTVTGLLSRPPVQRLLQNKRALIISFILVTLAIITISTNQHEAIISSLPSITISHKPSDTPVPNRSSTDSTTTAFPKFTVPEDKVTKVVTQKEHDGEVEEVVSYEPIFTADDAPPKFALSDDDIDRLLQVSFKDRLDLFFPYETSDAPIDKNILQKHSTAEWNNIGNDIKNFMTTWREPNLEQGFKHLLYDDPTAFREVLKDFALIFPEIVEVFDNLPKNILRYDFFRYLLLLSKGGTYADTDTVMLKPFSEWPVYQPTINGVNNTVGFVTAIENECDCLTWFGIVARRIQFCQWTIQAKKHHPVIKFLVNRIVDLVTNNYDVKSKVLKVRGKEYNFNDSPGKYYDGVMELTGPGVFTDAVFLYLNSLDHEAFEIINPNNMEEIYSALRQPKPESIEYSKVHDPNNNPNVGWEDFTNITDPVLINRDIVVAPRSWFNKKSEDPERNLVEHRFHGSWKSSPNKRELDIERLELDLF